MTHFAARTLSRLALLLSLLAGVPLLAADPRADALHAQLQRIFSEKKFEARKLGPSRWTDGGKFYTTLEPAAAAGDNPDAQDIVRYDAATGARQVLVPAASLVAGAGGTPLEVDDFAWSGDGAKILLFANTKKVWRRNTRGDYWVLEYPGGRLRKLGAGAARGDPHVREVLPRRNARRLRPEERSLRRRSGERKAHPSDLGRISHDHQRHLRLGLRGRVRPARRLPLEPRRKRHRVLAFRRQRHRGVFADQRHGHALPRRHEDPVSQGRNDEPGRQDRDRVRLGRRAALGGAAGRPAQHVRAADGVGQPRRGRPPAAQPAPERERRVARRREDRQGAAHAARRGRRRGSTSSTNGNGCRAASSSGSATGTAGGTPTRLPGTPRRCGC